MFIIKNGKIIIFIGSFLVSFKVSFFLHIFPFRVKIWHSVKHLLSLQYAKFDSERNLLK